VLIHPALTPRVLGGRGLDPAPLLTFFSLPASPATPVTAADPGADLLINGTGFGTSPGTVTVQGLAATVVSWTATAVRVTLAAAGSYPGTGAVVVNKPGALPLSDSTLWVRLGQNLPFGASLSVADNPTLSMGNVSFTIMTWVKPTQVGTGQVVLGKATAATVAGVEYDMQINAAGEVFVVLSSGTNAYPFTLPAASVGVITAGVWNMIGMGVAVSGNPLIAGSISAYKNGDAGSSLSGLPAGVNVQDGLGTFTLGGVIGALTYAGGMDAIGVWRNRCLSAAENLTLYNGGAGYRYDSLPAAFLTNLAAWYELQEPTGATSYVDRVSGLNLTPAGVVTQIAGKV
jgi:hypothetical protein